MDNELKGGMVALRRQLYMLISAKVRDETAVRTIRRQIESGGRGVGELEERIHLEAAEYSAKDLRTFDMRAEQNAKRARRV